MSKYIGKEIKHCSQCGHKVSLSYPDGDNRLRYVCNECDYIHYENPNIVTGVLPIYEGRILMCKRAIEPKSGLWTLPAGFMENGETLEQAALREAKEEAGIEVRNPFLYNLFSLPHINQVYAMFLGEVVDGIATAGEESLEVEFFVEEELPWDQIAFLVIERTLKTYLNDKQRGHFPFHHQVHNPFAK